MRYSSINQRRKSLFAHSHFVPDFGWDINKLEYFMLAKAGVNDISVYLHILECLITPMINFVNDLVYIIGWLLLTQLKQISQRVSLLWHFLPSWIFWLLLIAIAITIDAIDIVAEGSRIWSHLRRSSERACCSILVALVVIVTTSRHEKFKHGCCHDLLLKLSSRVVSIPFKDVIG